MGTRRWFDNTFADTWGPVLFDPPLRERHPGLGLKEAADLVDARR
ncbi:ribosomal protein L7/L12 [Rhodococcoides fascians]|nr:ribosomal protein L7/L12 [Rhodococcus fascians]